MADPDVLAVRELLRDAFTRLIEHVEELADGLSEHTADYRPTHDGIRIAGLIRHCARVLVGQVAVIGRF